MIFDAEIVVRLDALNLAHADTLAEELAAKIERQYGPEGVRIAGIDACVARATVEAVARKPRREMNV